MFPKPGLYFPNPVLFAKIATDMNPEYGPNLAQEQLESPSQQEAVTKPFKKTPLMLEFEQRFIPQGETIGDILTRLYTDEGKIFSAMAHEFNSSGNFNIGKTTLITWIRMFNPQIQIKSPTERLQEIWGDPQRRQQQISRIRAQFEDPQKREQIAAKTHTPQAKANRSRSLSEYFKNNPEAKKRFVEAGRTDARRKAEEAQAARTTALGPNPKETLTKMLDSEGLSRAEIAKRLGLKLSQVYRLTEELNIEFKNKRRKGLTIEQLNEIRAKIQRAKTSGLFERLTPNEQKALNTLYPESGKPPTQTQVAKELGGLTRERIRQLDNSGLAKLESMLNGTYTRKHRWPPRKT